MQCIPLLETSLQAAKAVGIPKERVYILELPKELSGDKTVPFKTATQLIEAGIDVDFGSVIRSVAGLDSIAQAAGR